MIYNDWHYTVDIYIYHKLAKQSIPTRCTNFEIFDLHTIGFIKRVPICIPDFFFYVSCIGRTSEISDDS